ncbi:hypothetical protein [Algoriphagus marinus]|uniref:hypothetical protein n=1 Tax=Algoriphagus marinus TaxID=1925762 RepID=UPI00094B9C8F|nr:hypothetical protein [Algoriphagus marinus]
MNLKSQLFLVIFLVATCQGKTFGQQLLDLDKTLLIKISPLSFIEPETIVIQGGVEYFFNPKISFQTELGINGGVFGIPSKRGKNEDFSLWRSKSEIKFHQKKFYWGFEFFYVDKDFIRTDDYYTTFKQKIWYDKARINFQVYGTGLKFGRQHWVSDNILLDSFAGIGIRSRFREIVVIELSENQNRDLFDGNFWTGDRYRFEGWDSVMQFSLGIKVGILTGAKD